MLIADSLPQRILACGFAGLTLFVAGCYHVPGRAQLRQEGLISTEEEQNPGLSDSQLYDIALERQTRWAKNPVQKIYDQIEMGTPRPKCKPVGEPQVYPCVAEAPSEKEEQARRREQLQKQAEAIRENKAQQERRDSRSAQLLSDDKLRKLRPEEILQMAGYPAKPAVTIRMFSLSLENALGYPTINANYYAITPRDSSRIDKIVVALHDLGQNAGQATNLRAYAPMVVYQKVHMLPSPGMDGFAHYVPKEFSATDDIQKDFAVFPHKANYFVFTYGEQWRANEAAFRGDIGYSTVCTMVFNGIDDLYGKGQAQLRVGEDGKFHLTNFISIYP